ncbi:hypothetical protein L4D09_03805 [Photobacterium makurazakiensis]
MLDIPKSRPVSAFLYPPFLNVHTQHGKKTCLSAFNYSCYEGITDVLRPTGRYFKTPSASNVVSLRSAGAWVLYTLDVKNR